MSIYRNKYNNESVSAAYSTAIVITSWSLSMLYKTTILAILKTRTFKVDNLITSNNSTSML